MGDWCKVRCGRPSPGVIHPIILIFITFQIARHFWQGKLNLFLFKMAIAWLLVKSYSSPGEIHRRQEKYICKKNSLYWLTKMFSFKFKLITSYDNIKTLNFLCWVSQLQRFYSYYHSSRAMISFKYFNCKNIIKCNKSYIQQINEHIFL